MTGVWRSVSATLICASFGAILTGIRLSMQINRDATCARARPRPDAFAASRTSKEPTDSKQLAQAAPVVGACRRRRRCGFPFRLPARTDHALRFVRSALRRFRHPRCRSGTVVPSPRRHRAVLLQNRDLAAHQRISCCVITSRCRSPSFAWLPPRFATTVKERGRLVVVAALPCRSPRMARGRRSTIAHCDRAGLVNFTAFCRGR